MPTEVTDPDLLNQLNGTQSQGTEVADPSILAQLNGTPMAASPVQQSYQPPNMDAPLANNPMAHMSFLRNLLYGVGETGANLGTGAAQLYARTTGNQSLLEQLQARTASDRQLYAPVNASAGGKTGQFLENTALTAPLSMTGVGAFASGAALGGLQPTVAGENPLTNAALGGSLSLAGYGAGKALGGWAASRAEQPFMGWNPGTANRVAAEAVGEDAPKLTQDVVDDATRRLGDIFERARDPGVSVTLGADDTLNAITKASRDYGSKALADSEPVQSLLSYAEKGGANAQELGQLSTELRQAGQSELGSKMGDKALGRGLMAVKEHVDDLIGSSIQDPELAAQYAAARPQYANLMNMSGRSSILNSASGDVNMTALGKFLQRADRFGYARGNNTSPLYQAARWGQAEGMGKGMPEFDIAKLGLPTLKYLALNNPLSRAIGGVASRALSPIASGLAPAGASAGAQFAPSVGGAAEDVLPGLRIGLPGTPLPYLSQ